MEIKEYVRPASLDEAYSLVVEKKGFPLGGGAWVHMNVRSVELAVDLSALKLDYIVDKGDTVEIGAMATARQIETSALLNQAFSGAFARATEHLVGVQLRNLITIGGTVAGKYGFSDLLTLLLALDAKLMLYRDKTIEIASFLTAARETPFLIEKIIVAKNALVAFQSVRVTQNDFAILNACAAFHPGKGWQIAVGARPAAARLALKAAQYLDMNRKPDEHTAKEAGRLASEEISFSSDVRGSDEYRKLVCETLVMRAIMEAAK